MINLVWQLILCKQKKRRWPTRDPHSVHWCINSPSKAPPLSFLPSHPFPLKYAKCPSLPSSFQAIAPSILVFSPIPPPPPPIKIWFFSEPQKYLSFSSLTPSYLFFKKTKFIVNVSQFEFFDMTEKNSFVYKLFFCLKIVIAPPLEKVTPLFPTKPPLKIKVLSSPPFRKFGRRLNPPPSPSRKRGCTLRTHPLSIRQIELPCVH